MLAVEGGAELFNRGTSSLTASSRSVESSVTSYSSAGVWHAVPNTNTYFVSHPMDATVIVGYLPAVLIDNYWLTEDTWVHRSHWIAGLWSDTPVVISADFNFSFAFLIDQLYCDPNIPGDGFVWALQRDPRNFSAIGYAGGELGFGGSAVPNATHVSNSTGLRFDTNTDELVNGQPVVCTMGIVNGNTFNGEVDSAGAYIPALNFANGNLFWVDLQYTRATNNLSLAMTELVGQPIGVPNTSSILRTWFIVDMPASVGCAAGSQCNATMGFTAGTGEGGGGGGERRASGWKSIQ